MSNEKTKLVPNLRFQEFRGAGDWSEGRIADIAEVLQGYGFPERYQGKTTGEYPFYKVSDISNTLAVGKVFIEESANYITKDVLREIKAKPIPEGATIFAKIGEAIRSNRRAITTKPSLIDNNAAGVKRIEGKSTDLFVYFTMETIALIDYSGGVVPSVNKSAIENIAVKFPSPAEQQKIADCLSSADELIAAQTRKVDALKTHKKGLMQQLFPREGETQPRLRFPEFRGTEEWVRAILGDLSKVVRGGSPRPIDGFLTTLADGLNWLKIGDVDKEAKYVTLTEEKVRPEALSKTRVVSPGDLILSNSMSFGRPYILQIETCIHDGWIAITDIDRMAERDFLYYSISAPNSQSYFIDNAAGSGVKNLNADIIKALQVCFPSSAEQQKLADCLSTLDELIAAQVRKVEALKTHKKGLMQQLFPQAEPTP